VTARPAVQAPDLTSHTTVSGLTVTASPLATVPMVQAHLAIRLTLATHADLAVFDVLTGCWPDSPACARFEQHGGVVSISRHNEWLLLSLTCGSDRIALVGDTLSALTGHAYTDAQVQAAKAKSLQQAVFVAAQPGLESSRRMWQAVYGQVPPSVDPAPTPEAVDQVDTEQVRQAHRRAITPAGAHLVIVGDVDPDQVTHELARALADWSTGGLRQAPPPATPELLPEPRVIHQHLPAWAQTQIRLAAPTAAPDDLDGYAAALVASLVLAGNFASRVNMVLREDLGLAYRTNSALADVLGQNFLVLEADVNPAGTAAAMRRLLGIFEDFAAAGPTGAELDAAIGYTNGKYALTLSSQAGRASCLLSYLIAGVELSGIVEVPARITATTPAAVQSAAGRFAPPLLRGAVCGDTGALPRSWF
jgi:zinc protease